MMTPRSGSSLVAHIFHAHGLWVGKTDKKPGYLSFENIAIKNIVNGATSGERLGEAHLRQLSSSADGIRQAICEIVPDDTPWVFKTGIDSWSVWRELFPDAKFVFVKRPVDSIVASTVAKRSGSESHVRPIIERRVEFMNAISLEHGVPFVFSNDVVRGDFSSLHNAFEHCGIEFSPDLAKGCIKPEMWRF